MADVNISSWCPINIIGWNKVFDLLNCRLFQKPRRSVMWKRNMDTMDTNIFLKAHYVVLFAMTTFFLIPAIGHAAAENVAVTPQQQMAVQPGASNPTPEQLHQELRALKATMEKALNSMDIDTVIANVTDDIVFTTMNGDVARGRDEIRKYFEVMMKGAQPRVTSLRAHFEADDLSHLYGNNVAISFGSSKDHYTLANGDAFDVKARWSGTMVRRDGRWLIANFHYSTNMFDNPVLDAQRKFLLIGAAGVGTVLMLVSFLIGRARGKRLVK